MKKFICGLLTLVLILVFLTPAALAEEIPLWEKWGYDSLEEFLEDWDMTEEEYYELEIEVSDWDVMWAELQKKQMEEHILAYGGTPGIVNIMYNGAFITFPDNVPEIIDGRTFAPARAFFGALGGTLNLESQTGKLNVKFSDGKSAQLVIGGNTLSITEKGDTQTIELSAETYVKNSSTYIPVSDVAKAFGLSVFWDSGHKSVVLIDLPLIEAEIAKNFSIINGLLKMPLDMPPEDSGIYKSAVDLLMSITLFNTLDGDEVLSMGANFTIHSDGRNYKVKGSFDISGLIEYLLSDYMDYYYDSDTEDDMFAEMFDVADKLKDSGLELILNADKDVLYIKSPALKVLFPEMDENAWLSITGVTRYLDISELEDLIGLDTDVFTGSLSMDSIILSNLEFYTDWYYPIFAYEDIMLDIEYYKSLVGDQKFQKNGNDYSLKLTLEDISSTQDYSYSFYGTTEFDLDLNIKTNGEAITEISGYLRYRDRYAYPETRYIFEIEVNAERTWISFDIHMKNEMIINGEINIATNGTAEPVPKAPPAGDKIQKIEDLYPDDFYSALDVIDYLSA